MNTIPMPIQEGAPQIAAIHPLRFYVAYKERKVPNPENPMVPKTVQVAEEWCDWAKKGVERPTTGGDAVKRLMKSAPDWAAIKPFYENWKAGGADVVVNGTPLAVWAGVTSDVVELLKPYRIFAVEDLAEMNDGVMQKIPHPDISRIRDRAKKFLHTKDVADAVKEINDKDDVIKAQAERLAAMEKQMEALIAANQVTATIAAKCRKKVAEAVE